MADISINKFRTAITRGGATPATPGFAETEGQDPVNPSGSNSNHNPVTIGSPANGLSVTIGQVLSLGLASAGVTGALSGTDWSTFNNKENAITAGTTAQYWRGDKTFQDFATAVRGSVLTGYTVGANTALADTDTILGAFGKIQGQINARVSGTIASGQVAFGTGVNTVGGDSGFTWDNTNKFLTITRTSAGSLVHTLRLLNLSNTANTETSIQFGPSASGTIRYAEISAFNDGSNNIGLKFITGQGASITEKWRITPAGDLTATANRSILTTGNFTIQVSTANSLTLATNSLSRLFIDSAGLIGLNTNSPTNTLDVNGTTRIRTISNLGSTATRFLVASATGVISERTGAELAADIGATNFWTLTGSDIYRNSRIRVGSTSAPTERIDIDSDGGWLRVANGDRTGGVLLGGGIVFPFTSASANSRSWSISNDNGTYGALVIRRSATQSGDPKQGTLSVLIDNLGSVGINGTPTSFGSFTYLDVYGRATTHSGVIRLLNSNSSNGFQTYVLNGVCISQTIGSIPWTFGVNSGEQFRILANGNILFNTTTDLGFKHYFAGTTAFQGNVTFQENVTTDIVFGTTTGTKIGTATNQKLAFWNATPIVQPTTGVAAATLVSNAGTALTSTDTFDGYTLQQVVRALRNTGLLA